MLETNPIFYKDLLVSLNSKIWKSIIIFFTLIYFIILLFVIADYKNNTFSSTAGSDIFSFIWILQLTILCFIWYIKWLLSISDEKDKHTLEFIMITKINSWKFIIWKFLSNFFYIFLLALISLPFLGIWLVLGGVNIQDILLYFLYSTSYISVTILIGMVFSAISKNNIFSIIYGASAIPIFFTILWLIAYTLDYINIQESISVESFGYALFPIFLIEQIWNYEILNILGININFITLHILIYSLIIVSCIYFLYSKFKQYTIPNNKSYYYIGTVILFLFFLLFSFTTEDGQFLFIIFFLVTTFITYLLSENSFRQRKHLENYLYFGIITSMSLLIIWLINWFYIWLFTLIISIFFLFFTSYSIFTKYIKQWKWIINLFFIIFLVIFFYVIPAISTQFLNIKLSNPSQLLKTTIEQENIIKNSCSDNKFCNTYEKNQNDLSTNTIYYILYILLSTIFLWIWWKKQDKKL